MKGDLSSILGRRLTKYLNSLHEAYLPQQLFERVADTQRHEAYRKALASKLARKPDAHVLQTERGSILLAMEAIRLGASRVTLCEPWGSLASLYEMIIHDNDLTDRIIVTRKKFVDMQSIDLVLEQPPTLLVCYNLDCGLLGYGLAATLDHAWKHVLPKNAEVIPEHALVYGCPIELRTGDTNGFDLSTFNRYRWSLFYDRVRLGEEPYQKMADPQSCSKLDFTQALVCEPRTLEFTSHDEGIINAIAFWFELELDGQNRITNVPPTSTTSSWHQALQYLDQTLPVKANQPFSMNVGIGPHGIRFRPEGMEDPLPLLRLKPIVPAWHFTMLADTRRNDCYEKAITHAVKKNPSGHVLDIGTGTGLLALMAARTGASHITACERIPHLAEVAHTHFLKNGFSDRIQLSQKDSKKMKVPDDMPQKAHILISETIDHSLLGEGFLESLMHARAHLMVDDPTIIPASATVYATALELRTDEVSGFNLSALNLFRHRHYQGIKLHETAHRFLTEPFEAFHFNFYERNFEAQQKHFEAPAIDQGICNAIAFWYDLSLDEETMISTAPNSDITAWGQAVIFLDQEFIVEKGQILPITGQADNQSLQFYLEPLNYILEGGRSQSLEIPLWFNELSEEEVEMHNSTEAIRSIIQDEYSYICKSTLDILVEQHTALGYDPGLFSDFITQIYNTSGLQQEDGL